MSDTATVGSRVCASRVSVNVARCVLPGLSTAVKLAGSKPSRRTLNTPCPRESGEAELAAVAGDRAHLVRLVKRDLGAGEPDARAVGDAADQNRRHRVAARGSVRLFGAQRHRDNGSEHQVPRQGAAAADHALNLMAREGYGNDATTMASVTTSASIDVRYPRDD